MCAKLLIYAVLMIGTMAGEVGCALGPQATAPGAPGVAPPAPRPAVINHIVFIKLVDPSQANEAIADCDAQLATIPGVVFYACSKHLDTGRPLPPAPPGGAVNADYDVAIYLGFDSREALDGYVVHPNHVATVNKWKDRMAWIHVQDVFDPTP